MAGTKAGGIKARETNYKYHGADFYKRIGRLGGQNGHTGGFASNPELARRAAAIGGRKSKRGISAKRQKIYAILEANAAEVMEMRRLGANCLQVALEFKLPYKSVYAWISRKEARNE